MNRTLLCAISLLALHAQAAPDLIVHHGDVVTVDADFRHAQAMAIEAGRITAVGTNEEVLALKGPQTELVDLSGGMVLPGLMDSHVHPVSAATFEFDHTIPDMPDIAAVLDYVKQRAQVVPAGGVIYIRQVFITRLKEQRYPTRAELDAAAPQHIVHFSTGPDAMLNTMGLQRAGIDKTFRVPEGQAGFVELDADGEPTGLLRSISPKFKDVPASGAKSPTSDQRRDLVKKLFTDYNSVGFTTIADRGASAGNVAIYADLKAKQDLTVRVRCSHTFPTGSLWPAIERALDEIIASPHTKPDLMLQIVGTKVWLDGGMLTGSALMQEPWGVSTMYGIRDPQYRGVQLIPTPMLQQMVRKVASAGLQFTAHSVGDAAVQTLLDVYADVAKDVPDMRRTRPCITHCNFMSPKSIEQAAQLGAVIDLQPIWFHLDGRTLLKQFGPERTERFQPLRALFDAKVPVGGGSDHMQKIGSLRAINAYNPWLGMWIAVSRECRFLDEPLHLKGGLTREEALRMFTILNAQVLFLEKDCGSLEVGKCADFIVVDRDVLKCPLSDLKNTQVKRTWLHGRTVWRRD